MNNVKKIIAIMLVISTMFGFIGCGFERVEEVSKRDFKNALENVFGVDDDEIIESTNENGDFVLLYTERESLIVYVKYDDEDDAYDAFEEFYDEIEDIEEDYDIDNSKKRFDENSGYAFIRISDEDFAEDYHEGEFAPDDLIYAGYYTGSMFFSILCTDNNIDEALELIEVLGMPSI